MIRAIIVDDEQKSRNSLKKIIERYCPEVKIVGMADSKDAALNLFLKQRPNLLFLDIEMPYGSGFDLLKQLPTDNYEVIFITGFDHYALKAIKFHALDYLLKPLDIEELIQAVHKVKLALAQTFNTKRLAQLLHNLDTPSLTSHKIAIPTNSGREFISVDKIIRLEADGSCSWFFIDDSRKLLSSKNLGEYEKLLPDVYSGHVHFFFRVHHSHLINLYYLKLINRHDNFVEMKDGSKIGIAQRRKAVFLNLLKKLNMF